MMQNDVAPVRSLSRKPQFTTLNQFTLDFIPPLFIYIHSSVAWPWR